VADESSSLGQTPPQREPEGGPPPAFVLGSALGADLYDDFFEALERSLVPYELGQQTLFKDEDEKFICDEVERKLYEPKLPCGGDKERKVIAKLKKLAEDREWEHCWRAREEIGKWEAVLPQDPQNAGAYYVRREMSPRDQKEDYVWCKQQVKIFRDAKQWDRKWFMELLLDGSPEPVSDFEIQCLFLLRKSNGEVQRLVRLRNILGEVSQGPLHEGTYMLDKKAFASPERFREWCLGCGNFAWFGNQVALQKLHQDYTHGNAWRIINQVDSCGWVPVEKRRPVVKNAKTPDAVKIETGIWFCEDCAYADGKVLLPDDKDGIYWYDGQGYFLNRKGRESSFQQGKPKMKPHLTVTGALRTPDGFVGTKIDPAKKNQAPPSEVVLMRGFFREVCDIFYNTVGGYEGWLVLGSIFSYKAAPEIFKKERAFPGLWLHGQMSSGKTMLAGWLMNIEGLDLEQGGIGLMKASAVGLMQETENYSNLPLLCDEFRAGKIHEAVEAVLRDAYNRLPPVKWTPDGVQRVIQTNFLVCGESTSSDAAMRSRYPHVQVSKDKRLADHRDWFQAHKGKLFLLSRMLLERREEFVRLVMKNLEDWDTTAPLPGVNNRDKFVHGVCYAAWRSVATMLNSHTEKEIGAFAAAMVEHAKASAADVTSETNINIFWTDLMTAVKAGEIDASCFRLEKERKEHAPGNPDQVGHGGRSGWWSYKIFLDPDSTTAQLQMFLVKLRGQITLQRKDLRDQLSKSPGWIEGKFTKRFGPEGGKGPAIKCWGFELDSHAMGYQPVGMEEYDYWLEHPDEADPRLGPLYEIVNWLTKHTEKEER
jgi:hypothetical protein